MKKVENVQEESFIVAVYSLRVCFLCALCIRQVLFMADEPDGFVCPFLRAGGVLYRPRPGGLIPDFWLLTCVAFCDILKLIGKLLRQDLRFLLRGIFLFGPFCAGISPDSADTGVESYY